MNELDFRGSIPESFLLFPKDFLWGVSTAAHQVEGGNCNQWSDWELAGRIKSGDRCGQACDWWENAERDFDIARDLGLNALRLSLEWSRIEPEQAVLTRRRCDVIGRCWRPCMSGELSRLFVCITSPTRDGSSSAGHFSGRMHPSFSNALRGKWRERSGTFAVSGSRSTSPTFMRPADTCWANFRRATKGNCSMHSGQPHAGARSCAGVSRPA